MDTDIARWTIDFLLHQPIQDRLLHQLITLLPLPPSNPHLMKKLLLRKLSSQIHKPSLSPQILETLEMIEELDFQSGAVQLPHSIKQAYCAVAVDCTVRCLRNNSNASCDYYYEAICSIWRDRFGDMDKYESVGLVSDQLKEFKGVLEAALWDAKVRNDLLKKDTRNDAINCVRAYLAEAEEAIGPSFLDLAAAEKEENARSTLEDNVHQMDVDTTNENPTAVPEVVKQVQEALKTTCLRECAGVKEAAHRTASVSSNIVEEAVNVAVRPSLMQRNPTARRLEWSDDEDTIEASSGQSSMACLPTSVSRRRNFAGRRRKRRWSAVEGQTLIDAVREYGVGNWKLILDSHREIFDERTVVDLKDKWRNMTK